MGASLRKSGEQEEIFALLADISFYQKAPAEIARVNARSEALAEELLKAYQRWEYLDASRCHPPF